MSSNLDYFKFRNRINAIADFAGTANKVFALKKTVGSGPFASQVLN